MITARRTPCIELPDSDVIAALRQLSSEQCFALIGDAHEAARDLAEAGVRHMHPDWPDERVLDEVGRRLLGEAD